VVPPPDPDVSTVLPQPEPDDEPKTTKQLVEAHMEEERCRVCHGLFDPYGFAFEHFDAVGVYRKKDNGLTIDSSGEIASFGSFSSPRDIADLLISDELNRTSYCIMLHLLRGSLGHVETDGEEPSLDKVHTAFINSDFSLQSLLEEMTVSDAFLYVAEEEE